MSVGFTGSQSNTKIPLRSDTITIVEMTVNSKIDNRSIPYEKQLKAQTEVTEELVLQLGQLNDKIPNMNTTAYKSTVGALNEEFGIGEEAIKQAFIKEARLTNLTNLLIFLGGIGLFGYLLTNQNAKRGPDVVLKISTGVISLALLVIMKISLVTIMTGLFNPTYRIIEQFIMLGG